MLMRRDEMEQLIRDQEILHGLGTGELKALWQQESSGSTDPSLKGVPLSRGRGNAIGPWQVVPAFHPDFPATGDAKAQTEFAAALYAKGGATQAERLKKYYGVGTPPAGHPSTSQYINQVQARMPKLAALTPQTITDTPTFQPLIPTKETSMTTPDEYLEELRRRRMAAPRYSDYVPELPQQRELSFMDRWATNPLTQMGAAMMVGSGIDWARAGGMGLMAANNAVYNRQQAEAELAELQQKRAEARYRAAREQRKSDIEDASYEELMKLADSYEVRGDRQKAQMIRAGITSGMGPETFHASKTFVDPTTGKPITVMTGSQGTVKQLDNMGIPIAYDETTARNIAFGKGEGSQAGETGVKNLTGMYETANAAATGLKAVEDMKTLMDRGVFTGRGDELTREVAGWYSWATGKELPKLAATEQSRLLVQDIVLPALANMKGASSDRDVAMLQQYAQGTGMTETALRGALDRVSQKYGSEIDRYNRAHSQYTEGGKKPIVGFEPMEKPKGYIARPEDEQKKKRTGWSLERGQ